MAFADFGAVNGILTMVKPLVTTMPGLDQLANGAAPAAAAAQKLGDAAGKLGDAAKTAAGATAGGLDGKLGDVAKQAAGALQAGLGMAASAAAGAAPQTGDLGKAVSSITNLIGGGK